MVPIYLCSIAAVALFLAKWMQFRAGRLNDLDWLEPLLEALRDDDLERARERARTTGHPAARAITAALTVISRRPERAEAEAARVGSLELQTYERHLGGLSFVAQAAPLLGLLGTVIGMVLLFIDLEHAPDAAGDISRISGGLWTALLTTAAGLVVAVLALAGHGYLTSRTDRLRLLLHDAVERALSAIPPAPGASSPARVAPGPGSPAKSGDRTGDEGADEPGELAS